MRNSIKNLVRLYGSNALYKIIKIDNKTIRIVDLELEDHVIVEITEVIYGIHKTKTEKINLI
jgi:hypothetical protein